MGRHKKPTHLSLIDGNPGKRPLTNSEPQVKKNLTDKEAPKDLSPGAKKAWKIAIQNSPVGLLKSLDFAELKIWCVAYDLYTIAYQQVQVEGLISTNEKGVTVENPWLKIMNKQAEVLRACGSSLGFSPVARAKIKMEAEQQTSIFEIFNNNN